MSCKFAPWYARWYAPWSAPTAALALTVLLTTAPTTLAQAGDSAPTTAPAPAPAVASPAAPVPATPVPATPAAPVGDASALHVTGLTPLNSGVVQIALENLAHRGWHCESCDRVQAESGPCTLCQGVLSPFEQTLLTAVEVDPQAGTLRFEVLPEQRVRLSEIQAALVRFKVAFPAEQQFIPHTSTLRVAGPASAEDVERLVIELRKSKLFEKVTGSFVAAEHQAELSVRCAGTPARTLVEAAIVEAVPADSLADIVFTAGAAPRSGRG